VREAHWGWNKSASMRMAERILREQGLLESVIAGAARGRRGRVRPSGRVVAPAEPGGRVSHIVDLVGRRWEAARRDVPDPDTALLAEAAGGQAISRRRARRLPTDTRRARLGQQMGQALGQAPDARPGKQSYGAPGQFIGSEATPGGTR
jgi:hypothetical protein